MTASDSLVDAVRSSYKGELELAGDHEARCSHLAKVADALLYRARLEDALLDRRRTAAPALAERLVAAASSGVTVDLDEAATDPWAAIVDAAPQLVRAGSPGAGQVLPSLLPLLLATELPEVGGAGGAERQRLEAEAMNWLGLEETGTFDTKEVEDYLRRRPLDRQDAQVKEVVRLGGGFSKHTTLVRIADDDGVEELVLRQAPAGRPAPGLAAEFGVLEFAWRHGIPVPEPVWIEPTENELGGAFFASRRVSGVNQGDVFGPSPGVETSVACDLATIAAQLHGLDLTDLEATPIPPMATPTDLVARIGEQEAIAAIAAGDGSEIYQPLFALVFAWLRTNVPAEFAATLVHGDIGFHNILVRDGRVQALLDWERATVGDAAIDLAYLRPQVQAIMAWDDFVSAYVAAGGQPRPASVLRYYTVWQDVWRAAGALKGRGRFVARPVHLLDAVTGLLHAPRFLQSAMLTAFGPTDD